MDIAQHFVAKHLVFARVEANQCSLAEAACSLGLSYRQTIRWWNKYRAAGGSLVDFARRAPRGGTNRLAPRLAQAVIDCKRKHPHRSVAHIAETVTEEHGTVSISTAWRILRNADLLEAGEQPAKTFSRFEASAFGERVQMDTTSGAWIVGYRLIYLIAALDDYSRMLLGWRWVESDSAWNNMQVLRSIIEKHGLPQTLYTDNASMFKTIRHDRSIYQKHRQDGYETEIQRSMRELGVTMFSHKPYEPQSKGKIERFFRFVQERFVREHTAKNLIEMNEQFEKWARWYNRRHVNRTTGRRPKDRATPSVFDPVPDRRRLDSAFCFKSTRKVDKCNTISVEGEWYRLETRAPLVHRTVDVEMTPFELRVYHRGALLQLINRENP